MTVLREAANILDISEYDVLLQAYQHWYGKHAPYDQLNRAFSSYLKTQQPPHWARHYALGVIANFETEMGAKYKSFSLFWQVAWRAKARPGNTDPVLFA